MSATKDVNKKLEAVAPSHAIVKRVAALEGVDLSELDPLFGAIDPDALDTLVETTGHSDAALQIEFPYHGYDVTVTGEGVVHIDEDVPFER